MEKTITVSAAFLGEELEFIEGPLTIAISEGQITSIERGNSGEIDMRGYAIMPPLANMHAHILDYSLLEEGWDLDIDSIVGEPYGLKYVLLRKKDKVTLATTIRKFINYSRSIGVGFIAEFRELGIQNALIDFKDRERGHYVMGMPDFLHSRELREDSLSELLRFTDGIGISSPLYYSDSDIKTAFHVAKSNNKFIFSHVSETKETHEKGDFQKLIKAGTPDAVIHGVWLNEEELLAIKDKGIPLILCPRSNIWFLSGLPDFRTIHNYRIEVSLGTDNAGWNKPDMWREAETLYYLARLRGVNDPTWVLKATVNTKPIGINNTIKEGSPANVLFIRYEGSPIKSARNKHVALVKRGGNELIGCLVMNGEAIYCGEYEKEKALRDSIRHGISRR